ncbi:MAG: NAD(P)H-hydrate dehydratase [Candidatus Zixiibacteriota bacterium]|nr:MAG: NAD(P)H-hydrate dehydratase [candidate division Zixibacteria bacterium]
MKKIATAEEMRRLDQAAIEETGIPGLVLMENASWGILRTIREMIGPELAGRRILIACGKGNNGGDGYAVARHLLNRKADVRVLTAGPVEELKGDALTNARIFQNMGGSVTEVKMHGPMPGPPPGELIVDALLGTGVQGAAKGLVARMIDWINARPEPVLAVDIPSGVDSDTGQVHGPAVRAECTVTMGMRKRGLVLPPGRELAGRVSVANISLPPGIWAGTQIPFHLLEKKDIPAMLPRRARTAHKGDCGRAFVLAGSPGMTGAAALCSQATLRIGAGLVILGIPASLNPILEAKLTEVITRRLAENREGCLSPDAMPVLEDLVSWADVVGVGPGLSQHPDTEQTVRMLLGSIKKPLVIDADGLNVMGMESEFAGMLPPGSILTPHPGEFSRLTGMPVEEILTHRVDLARRKAADWGAVLVLKGSPTIIADPGGAAYCNPTGGPVLATGGSGDVLTGMILGLLAQGCPPLHAACAGVFLHGLAGDLAAREIGVAATVAGDLDRFIPRAVREVWPEA